MVPKKTLESPLESKEVKPVNPKKKKNQPEYSFEGLMLKLKLQYCGHLMQTADSLEKTDAGEDWGQEEKGETENEMVGWRHQLDEHVFEWVPGDGEGQGSLACCSSWACKESDMT